MYESKEIYKGKGQPRVYICRLWLYDACLEDFQIRLLIFFLKDDDDDTDQNARGKTCTHSTVTTSPPRQRPGER